jgi:DNA-binding FrmR family transcriptional regulator
VHINASDRPLSSRRTSAVSTALDSLGFQILDSHVNHCVAGALASGDEADAEAMTQELLEGVQRFAKMR